MDASPRTETKNQKKERKRRVAHSENAGICKRRVNEKNRTKVPHRVQDREAQADVRRTRRLRAARI